LSTHSQQTLPPWRGWSNRIAAPDRAPEEAAKLRIEWPSGIVQELQNVAARQILTVTEPAQLVPLGPSEFQIRCWKGMQFEVEKSHDLRAWDSMGTVTNATGTLTFQDAQPDPGAACCYYRVVSR